ncbi:histidine kinase [Methylobacterium sp. P31]
MRRQGEEKRTTVLVAEPQALPGLWLEDALTDAGCTVSGPYGGCDAAVASLDSVPPDFAVLSVDLNRGSCFPLACALRRRGIPFALISGRARVPRAFSDVPRFGRIFDAAEMMGAVVAGSAKRACGGAARTCPMPARIGAGEFFALDQCPTACGA